MPDPVDYSEQLLKNLPPGFVRCCECGFASERFLGPDCAICRLAAAESELAALRKLVPVSRASDHAHEIADVLRRARQQHTFDWANAPQVYRAQANTYTSLPRINIPEQAVLEEHLFRNFPALVGERQNIREIRSSVHTQGHEAYLHVESRSGQVITFVCDLEGGNLGQIRLSPGSASVAAMYGPASVHPSNFDGDDRSETIRTPDDFGLTGPRIEPILGRVVSWVASRAPAPGYLSEADVESVDGEVLRSRRVEGFREEDAGRIWNDGSLVYSYDRLRFRALPRIGQFIIGAERVVRVRDGTMGDTAVDLVGGDGRCRTGLTRLRLAVGDVVTGSPIRLLAKIGKVTQFALDRRNQSAFARIRFPDGHEVLTHHHAQDPFALTGFVGAIVYYAPDSGSVMMCPSPVPVGRPMSNVLIGMAVAVVGDSVTVECDGGIFVNISTDEIAGECREIFVAICLSAGGDFYVDADTEPETGVVERVYPGGRVRIVQPAVGNNSPRIVECRPSFTNAASGDRVVRSRGRWYRNPVPEGGYGTPGTQG